MNDYSQLLGGTDDRLARDRRFTYHTREAPDARRAPKRCSRVQMITEETYPYAVGGVSSGGDTHYRDGTDCSVCQRKEYNGPGHLVHTSVWIAVAILLFGILWQTESANAATPVSKLITGLGNTPNNQNGTNPVPYLRTYKRATVYRVIINDWPASWHREPLPAIQAAYAAHLRIYEAIQYSNTWTIAQNKAWFKEAMRKYGKYATWIAVGNEQELAQGGAGSTGKRYSQVWKAVEPIIAKYKPKAIRVAGEISMWGIPFLNQAFRHGLPGAQIVSGHPYPIFSKKITVSAYTHTLATHHLPVFWTEGGYCPHPWRNSYQSNAKAGRLGVRMSLGWMG